MMAALLILGGTGFIGRHLAAALRAAGHEVEACGRHDLDLARTGEAALAARLAGKDMVINAAGLVRGRGANSLRAVHAEGPVRLAAACRRAGVRRLIHLSALGADSGGGTAYQRSKGLAEDSLRGLADLDCCVLRPSLVIGRGGASTTLLCALAALPLPLRLGPGHWQVQPVHLDDLCDLVTRLASWPGPLPRSLDVVGPQAMDTDALTRILRDWLGLPRRPFLTLPASLLTLAAALGERLGNGPVNREMITLLRQGNTAEAGPFAAALGRPPQPLAQALAHHPAGPADLAMARLQALRPLLRWSLGLLWLVTGLLSGGLYPLADSARLLAEAGLFGLPAAVALYGGAALDLLLGALLLAGWRPAGVGAAMLAAMAAFTLLALRLPALYWLHPFAPLLKNLPIAAALLAMMALEA